RKPALASLIFSSDCSSSVCGIRGLDSALAVSTIPWNRSFLYLGSSISASDCGRPIRSSRSWARLLRLEIMVRMAKMPATRAANTSSGITSFMPTRANSGVRVARLMGVSGRGWWVVSDLDVDDLPDDQGAEDLGDDGEEAHLLAQRLLPQRL